MTNSNMQKLLEEVKASFKEDDKPSSKISEKMRKLAEARYAPAIDFFMSCLDSPGHTWRMYGVDLLGFKYEFASDSEILDKIRNLLLNDPDYSIRIKAAGILSVRSKWPDSSLRAALLSETNEAVLSQIFQAILMLAGVPYTVVKTEVSRVKGGEIKPTFAEIERITQEVADEIEAEGNP